LNIKVNCVSPGYIKTALTESLDPKLKNIWIEKTPTKVLGQPSDLLGAYVYLATSCSDFTTGTDIIVDGGYCLP